jgi:hypothetical protein
MPRSLWPFPKLTPAMGFWRLQMFLLGVALAASGMYWLLQGNTNPAPQFLFTFIIGNCTWLAVTISTPLLVRQQFPEPIASAMIAVTRLLMLTPSFSACFVSFEYRVLGRR